MDKYLNRVVQYYTGLIGRHGDDIRATDWGGEFQQKLRFDVLLQAGILAGNSVLDVGCGRGDLFGYLRSLNYKGNYQGVDITPGMIDLARRRYPAAAFDVMNVLEGIDMGKYDYVVASGIFYILDDDNQNFFRRMVTRMMNLACVGIAFNMLSAVNNTPGEGECLFSPADVVRECQKITPFVTLRHDYKKNDFTVYLYHAENL